MKNFKIKQITLILFTSALLFGCSVPKTEELSRPNILFIIADDASRDSMGIYGSEYVKTPNFDRIGREGVMFKNAYVCNPKCSPARACLLTGRYSWQLEEATNHRPILSDKWKFYPDMLAESGYTIGLTGKGWGPGEFNHPHNPAGPEFNKIKCKPPYTGINSNDYSANFAAFLETTTKDKPFCFWLGAKEPHRGYEKDSWKKAKSDTSKLTVPTYFPDNPTIVGDLADYALEVEWYDQHIGKCLKTLEEKGLLDNTIIIATSDHGMPFPRIKGQVYEDGFHTPFVVRWGKGIKPGRVVNDFITFPDLAPTLLELAGIAKHPQMTGKSFLDVLKAEKSGTVDPTRDHTILGKERHDMGRTDGNLITVSYPARAIRNEKYLYVRNFKPERWPVGDPEYGYLNCDGSPTKKYLVDLEESNPDYKYFQMAFGLRPGEELYDMVNDLDCINNLAMNAELAETKEQLWAQLKSELTKQGDPRILGKGDIFDYYPNPQIERQEKLYGDKYYDPIKAYKDFVSKLN